MISSVLRTIPLVWPSAVLSALLALGCSRWLARRLGSHRLTAFLLMLSLGGIAGLTLTPELSGEYLGEIRYVERSCATGVHLPRLSDLADANQDSLNVALFLPLGIAVALIPDWRRVGVTAMAAATLPCGIEAAQYALPWLLRSCDLQDIADNGVGLALGLVAGCAARPLFPTVTSGARRRGRHHFPYPHSRMGRAAEGPAPAGREAGTGGNGAWDTGGQATAAASAGEP